jgi:hypothetical protein
MNGAVIANATEKCVNGSGIRSRFLV